MQIFVPLSHIADNPYQRRTEYGDIAELAADIHRHKAARPGSLGLLQLPAGRVIFRNASEPDGRMQPVIVETTTTRPSELILDRALAETRTEAIGNFCEGGTFSWRQCKRMGWACVKVKLVEVKS